MAQGEFRHRKDGSALQKVSAALGFLVTAAMVAFLAWKAITMEAQVPPAVEISADRIVRTGGSYIVEFVAINNSPATAADLEVEGVLKRRGAEVEQSHATLDYVPGESTRRGGLMFTHDPAAYALQIRATGYQEP